MESGTGFNEQKARDVADCETVKHFGGKNASICGYWSVRICPATLVFD